MKSCRNCIHCYNRSVIWYQICLACRLHKKDIIFIYLNKWFCDDFNDGFKEEV